MYSPSIESVGESFTCTYSHGELYPLPEKFMKLPPAGDSLGGFGASGAVSYTHLTLPTKA